MNSPLNILRDLDVGQYNLSSSSRHKSPAHYCSGSWATYSARNLFVLQCYHINLSRLRFVIRNPAYIGGSENDYEVEIDTLAPLESCLAPIVTVSAEDEDMSEDRSILSLETDQSSDEDQVNQANNLLLLCQRMKRWSNCSRILVPRMRISSDL